jgi:hypothetical protein
MKAKLIPFLILLLTTTLFAEKSGSRLIIRKVDDTMVTGELLKVHGPTLLLLGDNSLGVMVRIDEVKTIRIVRGMEILKYLGLGSASGVGLSVFSTAVFRLHWGKSITGTFNDPMLHRRFLPQFVPIFTVVGALFGAAKGLDVKIELSDYSDIFEYEKALSTLRTYARERF